MGELHVRRGAAFRLEAEMLNRSLRTAAKTALRRKSAEDEVLEPAWRSLKKEIERRDRVSLETRPHMSLATSICRSAEEFSLLADEWDSLLEGSRSHSVFLSWGWLYAWWRQFGVGRELVLILVRDAGRLVGIGPFCIERRGRIPSVRVVSFLGTERVSSEYLDVIADPAREEEVLAAVWQALLGEGKNWDWLRLTDLLESSLVLRHLRPLCEQAGFRTVMSRSEICPYLTLPPAVETL